MNRPTKTTRTKPSNLDQSPCTPILRFTPTAWAKLLFLRDLGDSEVGGFGICPNDLLLVEDIRLVEQSCTCTTVRFDDDAVADLFDEQVDEGLAPEQFARVWIHTHPGNCPFPSHTDEETFSRVFGRSNWALMFILACGGDSYARLRFNEGPNADILLPSSVDFTHPFSNSDFEEWESEYERNVNIEDPFVSVQENFWNQDRFNYPDADEYDFEDCSLADLSNNQFETEVEAYGFG